MSDDDPYDIRLMDTFDYEGGCAGNIYSRSHHDLPATKAKSKEMIDTYCLQVDTMINEGSPVYCSA